MKTPLCSRAVAIICAAFAYCAAAQTPPFFNVRSYGAAGDGVTLDTPAINAAIIAANAAGGGTVTFPAGNYASVSIHLSNNITLYLSNNAVILAASTNGFDAAESNPYSSYQDYGHSHFHDSLIWGENLTNIGFSGPGKIDGNAVLVQGNPTAGQGDKAISLKLCTNVVFSDITITHAGHFGILANGCSNMIATGVQLLCSSGNNHRDAFNLISSSDVIVSNCVIQGSDDAMVLKSDYALGQKINSRNIHIRNCQILSTQNNATQFGSETVGDFRDVSWSDLQISGAGKAGIGITSQDGSVIDGVTYDNITMSNCACPIFLKLDYRTTDSPSPSVGRIRNISINNVTAYHSTLFSRTNTSTINGYFNTNDSTTIPIENITFNNVNVSNIGQWPATAVTNYPVENQDWQPQNFGKWPSYGWYLRWAKNISFTNCQAHFDLNDDRPAVITDSVTNVLFDHFTADIGTNDTNYDMGFLRTTNFEATNAVASTNAPSPGAGLRIFTSNAVPAIIVSPPYFSPGDGVYGTTQSVAIASGTAGATIRYTTDGTTPTSTNGTIYSGPVSISSETVLAAIAYKSAMTDSAVNVAIYNFPGTSLTTPPPPPPPLPAFSFEAESLSYATNGAVAVLQSDSNSSGGHWLAFEAGGVGQYIDYTIPNIPAGTYDFEMSYKGNTQRGIVRLMLDGNVLGSDLDQYSATQIYPTQDYGTVTFLGASNHIVRLTAVGKNPSSTGYWISTDQFIFNLLQPPPPVLNQVLRSTNGSIQLGAVGYPSLSFTVLASTNLAGTNWVNIGSAGANSSGVMQFIDTNAMNFPDRFYRLLAP